MKEIREESLRFVLKYYQKGKLDTSEALKAFRRNSCIPVHRSLWNISAAASVVVLIVASLSYYFLKKDIVTRISGIAPIVYTLPDNTKVTLAPYSSISYDKKALCNGIRNITMRGMAYFSVKHDELHPFTVNGDIGTVKVLGTHFQVDETDSSNATVYVEQGKVLFSAEDQKQGLVLTKGMKAVLYKGTTKPILTETGDLNQTTWATHKFIFNDTNLGDVLQTLSKYYNIRLSVDNTNLRLTGVFYADKLTEIIQVINEALDVNIKIDTK